MTLPSVRRWKTLHQLRAAESVPQEATPADLRNFHCERWLRCLGTPAKTIRGLNDVAQTGTANQNRNSDDRPPIPSLLLVQCPMF